MITEKISTNDIQRIGTNGTLEVTLPNYGACIAAKNLVTESFFVKLYIKYSTFASEYSFIKRLIYTFDRVYGT